YDYSDVTNHIGCCSQPSNVTISSKISWLVKNLYNSQVPVKVTISCVQQDDAWVQVSPLDKYSRPYLHEDISCGEEKYDAEKQKKFKNTIIFSGIITKIDHFAARGHHPSLSSTQAFKITSDDENVIIIQKPFFKHMPIGLWLIRFLLGPVVVIVSLILFANLLVKFMIVPWHYFSSWK
ncbi:MAG: hypothetical protein PVI40_08940, partial [Chlamydiota bacterium]